MAHPCTRYPPPATLLLALVALSGCTFGPTDTDTAEVITAAQRDTAAYTASDITRQTQPALDTTMHAAAHADGDSADTPLSLPAPLTQSAAVELMLRHSPEVQELIALAVADQQDAKADALPFSLGAGITQSRDAEGLAYSRSLSLNLMALITWPARRALADEQRALRQLELAQGIAIAVTRTRQAWVDVVAASQHQQWAQQGRESADAGAELAQRLQQAGNISEADRLVINTRLHHADRRLDDAINAEREARYRLARLTGLTPAQATSLQVPSRFSALPRRPPTTDALARAASDARLDVRLARQHLRVAAAAAGLTDIASLGDTELGLENGPGQDRATSLSLQVPVFDGGFLQRAASDQRTLAAAHALSATVRHSALRSEHAWATWKQRYDTAARYQKTIIPERAALSAETLKRYNGMLIDVFELLDDAQAQVETLDEALAAESAFWHADVRLQAALFGLEASAGNEKDPTTGEHP
jgi:outer membrane protein TolC